MNLILLLYEQVYYKVPEPDVEQLGQATVNGDAELSRDSDSVLKDVGDSLFLTSEDDTETSAQ